MDTAPTVRISCIVPTLNRGRILIDTVKMLRAQTQPPFEIIVVDQSDRHDPGTNRELEELRDAGSIMVVPQKEPNASQARNRGAVAATGDVLVFLDDDIVIDPNFLQVYGDAFQANNIDAVSGQIREGEGQTTDTLPTSASDPEIGWLYFPKNYARRCQTQWMASGNFGMRKTKFLELGGMDENYVKGAYREESDLALRHQRANGDFLFEPAASIYHLGATGAPEGGSRSWIRNKRIAGWHHCFGDWYFTVGFVNSRNWLHLLKGSLRHFVLNRYNVEHPWLIPFLFFRWLSALPPALYRRWRGPKLLGECGVKTSPC